MGNNETCKKSHEREKLEIGRRREAKASYNPELEEGEFRKDQPFGLENLVHKDMVAGVIKLSSYAQVAVKKGQVNTRRSTSPERGSHQGGTANTTVMQSECSSLRDQPVNVRQSTSHRTYSEKRRQSYSPCSHIRSKERHEQRTHNCFSYHDYHHVLKKIEEVCSERLGTLLLRQNKDRKEFNISLKKQESKFFQEHACSYRVHYERVIPTARYHRMKLPKLSFCILRKVFCKYMQSQLTKFVKRQINDRNKEKRIKERWIFEATAGYLKKCFDETSLTYSGYEMEKSKWHVHAYSEGEQQLKYFDMQSLTTEIEAIASSRELEENTNKESDMFLPEPVIESLQSSLETNGGAEHGLSADAPEEIAIVDSMSSPSNYAPSMESSQKAGTPQNEGEHVERSCSQFVIDEALALAKPVAADSENAPAVFGEKRRRMSPSDDALEGSCSRSQTTFPQVSDSNIHETALRAEIPQAERLPSVNVNQMEKADVAGSKEVSSRNTSSFGQVTEQQNTIATSSTLVQPSTQLQRYDPTCENAAHTYQPSGMNNCSVSAGLDNHGALNAQQQSANQTTTSSMVEHTPESGLQSDPVTNELSQLLMSHSDHTSSSAQFTEQQIVPDSSSLTQHVRQQFGDQTCQTIAHQYQPSGRNNSSVRTWLDSRRASDVQRQSNNQTTTSSTSGQEMLESGLQSDPLTTEMSQLVMLHDLMCKRHLSERQKIISEREMEMAECKRKFDEQFHNLEMETLKKKKDIEVLQDKICKQQILAEAFQETFQVLHKASTGVASCSQR
ncbi:hypothetical protein BAE44_0015791, partial [Dichanthelium oligosanthes]